VHRHGWVVAGRCFTDTRFSQSDLLTALEVAWRKMDPELAVSAGGCLSEFNPKWGRELQDAVWSRRMRVRCPTYNSESRICAHRSERDSYGRVYNLLVVDNVQRCMDSDGSGLAGVMFHESLHAAHADNYATAKHNKAWELPQFQFVGDRIYAAEAVCFFAHDPKQRPLVNFLQCKRVIEHHVLEPDLALCKDFDLSFTDHRAPGFIKH